MLRSSSSRHPALRCVLTVATTAIVVAYTRGLAATTLDGSTLVVTDVYRIHRVLRQHLLLPILVHDALPQWDRRGLLLGLLTQRGALLFAVRRLRIWEQ